ncbi:MAG: peptidoglycan-binding protein [bacterium]|nr:peptidoglycan-binding protein [bacterium]
MKRLLACLLLLAMMAALLPALSEEDAAGYQPLQYGDKGETVETLQQCLIDLGYYTGKVTGNFLKATRAAVEQFQKDYDLDVTGVVDGETEVLLLNAEYRALRYGIDGEDVKKLQEQLIRLGYLRTKATGKYRDATVSAVKEFQKQHSLEATGEATIATLRVLYSGYALAKGAQPTATPDPASMGGDMVIAGDGEALEDYAYLNQLSRGSTGEEVKMVQSRLKELGFFDGPVSGNYMNQTLASVKAFQEHNGLHVTGVTDEETWNVMFNDEHVLSTSATARPTPVPTPVPYAITVDVTNQITFVYGLDENGEYTVPVKQMICSTGTEATPSDLGDFVLSGRNARWCYFPAYGSHAQYWTKINEYIAFHSVTYSAVDYDALNVKSYNRLGRRASHGCVRLLVSDAQWIYENIREGVVVTITEDLPRDEELAKSLAAPPLNEARNGPSVTPEPTPAPEYVSGAMPPQPFRELKRGSNNEAVYWLQCKLKEMGYYEGTITGGYYQGTTNAVKAFQKDNKIRATGIADKRTLEAIYIEELTTPTPVPTATPAPTPEPEYISGGQPPLPLRQMRRKDTGEDVYWLQRKLQELGYFTGTVSGTYCEDTVNAVKAYQKDNSLTVDGAAGPKTLSHLYAEELGTAGK